MKSQSKFNSLIKYFRTAGDCPTVSQPYGFSPSGATFSAALIAADLR